MGGVDCPDLELYYGDFLKFLENRNAIMKLPPEVITFLKNDPLTANQCKGSCRKRFSDAFAVAYNEYVKKPKTQKIMDELDLDKSKFELKNSHCRIPPFLTSDGANVTIVRKDDKQKHGGLVLDSQSPEAQERMKVMLEKHPAMALRMIDVIPIVAEPVEIAEITEPEPKTKKQPK